MNSKAPLRLEDVAKPESGSEQIVVKMYLIMRRVIRAKELGEPISDISTLDG